MQVIACLTFYENHLCDFPTLFIWDFSVPVEPDPSCLQTFVPSTALWYKESINNLILCFLSIGPDLQTNMRYNSFRVQ